VEFGDRRHGRGTTRAATAAGLVAIVVMATVAALSLSSAGAPSASAVALHDVDNRSAIAAVTRITQLDDTIKAGQAALPAAEAAAAAAPIAAQAARDAEASVQTNGPPAPNGTSSGVVNAASSAILDELAPEQATATRIAADQAVVATTAHRDSIRGALAAASAERGGILADLEQRGQARTRWSIGLLSLLGDPVTVENVRGIAAWIGAESNNSRYNNPLATTMAAPGASDVNSVGVKSYPNDAIGLDATVRTLHNGFYPAILAALAKGDSAQRVVTAVATSPWGTGINAVRRLQLDG
jgi:hypothetical protein